MQIVRKFVNNILIGLNLSGVSSIPRTKIIPSQKNLKALAKHIRRKNCSQVFSESKKMIFKTPEVSEKNNDKGRNTAEVDKHGLLEEKSNNSYVEPLQKGMDLSDLLRSTDYDPSEFQNILEEDFLSSDLVSLSNNDIEIDQKNQEEWKTEKEILDSGNTPNFPNRIQSRIESILKNGQEGGQENVIEGKYLNMSLVDIPEVQEENATISEVTPSSFDKILNYNSNTSSKTGNKQSSNLSTQEALKVKKERSKGSGDSRFSTYMSTENVCKQTITNELSPSQAGRDSLILKPKQSSHSKYKSVSHLKVNSAEKEILEAFSRENIENNENLSLVSNSGNKDPSNYKSNRGVMKPRRIFYG